MNFGELLHTAKKNDQTKPQIRYYSTKFTPPKKEQKSKNVSVNVQKFLARKEAEEKQKRQDADERKTNLLALRSQDKKATRRVNVMLKRTKSANQSVIADALDSDNTAVTLAGPSQPDEDDYGYVSQESSALYNKMMEKYSKMPEEPKFPEFRKKVSTNLNSTKDRVKAALEKEKEEALLPHRRKRKHTTDSGGDSEKSTENTVEIEPEPEKKEPPKPKFKAAPMVNFSDLLKLAEKKQFEPVVIETKKEEEERPLTKKQKKEMEREKEWRERKESRNKMPPPQEKPAPASNRIPKINGSMPQTADRIPKKSTAGDNQDFKKPQQPRESIPSQQSVNKALDRNTNPISNNNNNMPTKSSRPDNKQLPPKPELHRKKELQPQRPLNGLKSSTARSDEKPRADPKRDSYQIQKSRPPVQNGKPTMPSSSKDLQRKNSIPDAKMKMPLQQNGLKNKQIPSNAIRPKQFPPNDLKPKQFPPSDLKPKQFPPSDLKPKQFPPPDLKKRFPPKDVKRKPMLHKRRIIDDDEDEYDSEMDDFIDDGPEEGEDYSNVISQIFGYDRRKYQFDEDDVDDMETSFAQQMKEEVISTKIGIMEDLEDMRQEEEAKKKKMLMKKRGKL